MKADDLLEAIGETDPEYALDAHTQRPAPRKRALWGTAAAGLAAAAVLAAALLGAGIGETPADGGLTTERVSSLEELERLYDGPLLAKALALAGAELSDIQLAHARDVDISDTSGWRSLSLTAERGEERLEMTCTFDVPESFTLPGKPDETLSCGGTDVWLFFGPYEGGQIRMDNACRALFIRGGVVYDMAFDLDGGDGMEMVHEYLELLLAEEEDGAEQDPGGIADALHPLESLMGFQDYKVTVEGDHLSSTWHFWLDLGGVETCVAETFGQVGDFGAYSVDLDGDGTPEVVTNNVYGDGGTLVRVFRYADGVFSFGEIDRRYYEELGFEELDRFSSVEERYDPERGVFVITNLPGTEREREVTFPGPEHLLFRRYAACQADHFSFRPLSYEELEHTDAKPARELFWQGSDYRIGIEHTVYMDIWHFFAGNRCMAEAQARPGGTPEVYSVELGAGEPGVPELVVNEPGGTVKVYVWEDMAVGELALSWAVLDAARAQAPDGNGRVTERFDPETGMFTLTVTDRVSGEIVYTERFAFESGHFRSLTFSHSLHGDPDYFTVAPAEELPGAEPAPDPAEAARALREVLEGEREFRESQYSGELIRMLDMEHIGETLTPGGSAWMGATDFALVDMDGDGAQEAVVRVCGGTDRDSEMGFVVLRWREGEVYGYLFHARAMEELKEDGTFLVSDGASDRSYSRISFDGARLDEHVFLGVSCYEDYEGFLHTWDNRVFYYASSLEDFLEKEAAQEAKAGARWSGLTARDIASRFD